MKVAIIGAGFTGLSAAWELLKQGHQITVFEKEALPGGLAVGFKESGWDWSLEKHYHHIFESDKAIQRLADEIGHPYKFYDVKSASLFATNKYRQLDSPLALLQLDQLSIFDRIRTGVVLGYLKYFAKWQDLESLPATLWLKKYLGLTGYQTLWEPLMLGKFGSHVDEVNMAWFWARIKARSQKLGYFDGGFLALAQTLVRQIEAKGGKVNFKFQISNFKLLTDEFDKIIVCGAMGLIKPTINYLGSITMVLRFKNKFLPENIYWLNIMNQTWPFLAIVEHTNMIDATNYNNEHLVYIGKYLPIDDKCMIMDDEALLKLYTPHLNKINATWKEDLVGFKVFRANYTQPIMPVNYSSHLPDFETANPRVLQASMHQVYPWDRGTNFAVELGQKVVDRL